jgi:CheY-like chemotaxis protein
MNLIVLLDVGKNQSDWEAISKTSIWESTMESFYNISIQPNIIILDIEPNIQKAVLAYSKMAYHYHDKADVSLNTVLDWVAEINKQPLTQSKLNKAFSKDNVWSRHVKDSHELLVEVKRGSAFDEKMDRLSNNSRAKSDEEKTLLELVAQSYKNHHFTIDDCRKLIEMALKKPIGALQKPNLLIIEDEEKARKGMEMSLDHLFNLFFAEDGKQAIEMVKKHKDIDLALLDIFLPDIMGTELYPKIREINDLIIVTALTAYGEKKYVEDLIRKGAYGFLTKPFNPHVVLTQFTMAWNKKVWPFFEDKINIQELSYIQRLYFCDHLINERKANKQLIQSKDYNANGYTKYQLNSMLPEVYNFDIYGIFPEFLIDPDLVD